MICMVLRTVVYCVGFCEAMISWTSRTVLGPRLHSTVRISNSASVGRGSVGSIYEDLTTKVFVCQCERCALVNGVTAAKGMGIPVGFHACAAMPRLGRPLGV